MENNQKYQSILKTGKELFWKYGIKRVSVEEICKEANVSKMTYYKFFQNKTELAIIIYKKIMDKAVNQFETIVNSSMGFEKKIEQFFYLKMENTKDISREFIADLYDNKDTGLAEIVKEYSNNIIKTMTEFFIKEQKNGNVRKDIKIEFIFYLMNKMQADVIDAQLYELYDNTQEAIMDLMRFFINGIIKK